MAKRIYPLPQKTFQPRVNGCRKSAKVLRTTRVVSEKCRELKADFQLLASRDELENALAKISPPKTGNESQVITAN